MKCFELQLVKLENEERNKGLEVSIFEISDNLLNKILLPLITISNFLDQQIE